MQLSIITINRNNADNLKKTIESVITQTFSDFEYIIIDGLSTDDSVSIIKQYEDKITYWVSEPDTGIYNAMNKGIEKSRGDYILFLNSGDYFLEENILERVFDIDLCDVDILYGNYYSSEDKSVIHYYPENITMLLFYISSLGHQASFFKKELFDDYKFDESNKIVSDWEFFIKKIIIENCRTKHMGFPVCYYNLKGISNKNREQESKERNKVLKALLPQKVLDDYVYLRKIWVFKHSSFYRYIISPLIKMYLYFAKK